MSSGKEKQSYQKEKLIAATGSISGVTGVLSSWQVCHNVCLGLIALLTILGITVNGMPLAFLTQFSLPIWIIAAVFLGITGVLYLKKKCISNRLLLINTGLIIGAIPFQEVQQFSMIFWISGGTLVVIGLVHVVIDKRKGRRCKYG